MKLFFSKKLTLFICLILLFSLCFLFRINILKRAGNFLISEDTLQKADAIFIPGGDSYDRGNMAVKLFNEGFASKIICLGENIPNIFKTLEISYAESEVTKINLQKKLISDSAIVVLKKGTSTKEEMDAINDYCKTNNLKKIIILSSKFHTRRIRIFFKNKFEEANIEMLIAGAPSSVYSEEEWWKSEEGLIMLNNEYVKLIYYFLKY